MEQFEELIVWLLTRFPTLLSDEEFRSLEMATRAEITRRDEIMDSAGIV